MLKEKLISDSYLGIEFGSTRIKAVLLSEAGEETGAGVYDWENDYENGYWTYSEEKIIKGMQSCYADLKKNVKNAFGVTLRSVKAIGISAMMHGYLPLDKNGNILTPFRTWRNTVTEKESSAGQ